MPSSVPHGALYLELYNAKTNDDLYRLMYAHAGAAERAATILRKAFPAWMDAADQHWRRYKQFVERWVRDTLTEADWQHLWHWVGRDADTLFRRLAPPPDTPRWSLAGWLVTAMKTHPHEPFSEAYRQIAERILHERLGHALRPRFCTACGRLFETDRLTQHYCSAPCRYRIHQRELRARRKRAREAEAAPGGATAPEPTPRHQGIPDDSVRLQGKT